MSTQPDLSLLLGTAGALTGAAGAFKSASGQKAALGYQASVAETNAQLEEQQARFALMNGGAEEQASRLKTRALLADQRAVAAANGVDVNSGSPVELAASARLIGENDALTIRDNAARLDWAHKARATGYLNEAAMDRSTASAINPWQSAAGSLLTSAGSVASSWYKYRQSSTGKGG